MNNVLQALRHMAEHNGDWYGGAYAGVWRLDLYYARSYSLDYVGFTRDDVIEFLKHYEEMTRDD